MTTWRLVREVEYVGGEKIPAGTTGPEIDPDTLRWDEREGFARYEQRARAADSTVRVIPVRLNGKPRWLHLGLDIVQEVAAPILPSGARIARKR